MLHHCFCVFQAMHLLQLAMFLDHKSNQIKQEALSSFQAYFTGINASGFWGLIKDFFGTSTEQKTLGCFGYDDDDNGASSVAALSSETPV